MQRRNCHYRLLLLLLVTAAGCADPSGVTVPSYDPSGSSREALKLYDTNGNGSLEAGELTKCPGLQAALPRVDQDGNGKLTAAEISQRITQYKAESLGLMTVECVVKRNGQPLPGATVTFVPEEFMKETLQLARGKTDASGRTAMTKEGVSFPGVPVGLYRVQVSLMNAGTETIPPHFNAETTLGAEVASDVVGLERGLVFDLK